MTCISNFSCHKYLSVMFINVFVQFNSKKQVVEPEETEDDEEDQESEESEANDD